MIIRSPHRLDTPAAERRVSGVGADVGEEAPAAFALGVGADFDGGGEGGAAAEVEVAEDEEFLQRGEVAEDGVAKAGLGKGELDAGFKVGADLLGLARGFDGLLDDGAGLEQVFDGGGGFRSGEA